MYNDVYLHKYLILSFNMKKICYTYHKIKISVKKSIDENDECCLITINICIFGKSEHVLVSCKSLKI